VFGANEMTSPADPPEHVAWIALRPIALNVQVEAKAVLAVTVTRPPLAGTTLRDAETERTTGRFDAAAAPLVDGTKSAQTTITPTADLAATTDEVSARSNPQTSQAGYQAGRARALRSGGNG